MNTEPTTPASSSSDQTQQGTKPLVIGFIVGAIAWLLPVLFAKLTSGASLVIGLLVAGCILPVIGIILAVMRRTRRFGLGLLLSCGLGWLVIGALCGGMFK